MSVHYVPLAGFDRQPQPPIGLAWVDGEHPGFYQLFADTESGRYRTGDMITSHLLTFNSLEIKLEAETGKVERVRDHAPDFLSFTETLKDGEALVLTRGPQTTLLVLRKVRADDPLMEVEIA